MHGSCLTWHTIILATSRHQDWLRGCRDDRARHRARPPTRSAMNTAPHPAFSYRIQPLDMRGRHLAGGQLVTILPVLAVAAFRYSGLAITMPAAWTARKSCSHYRRGRGEGQAEPGRALAVPKLPYTELKTAINGMIEASQGSCLEEGCDADPGAMHGRDGTGAVGCSACRGGSRGRRGGHPSHSTNCRQADVKQDQRP
jgi:hypothetical protein